MVSRSSSGRARRMLTSWHALALLFVCVIGCANAAPGLRIGAVSNSNRNNNNSNFLGRQLQKEDQKDEKEKDKEKENEKDQEVIAENDTEATTASPFSIIDFELASFTVLIDGSVSEDDELLIREELEQYLFNYFVVEQEDKVGINTDSIALTMAQIIESYTEPDEGSESGVRGLQSDTSAIAVSTLLEYDTSANLRFEEDENEDIIVDLYPDVLEIQVKALEDTKSLQGHFIELFSSDQEDPVIFIEVEVGDRPPVPFDSEGARNEIQSILDPSASIVDTMDETSAANANANISDGSSNKGRLAAYVGSALVGLLIGLCVIVFFMRKKKRRRRKNPEPLSISYRQHDHVDNDDKATNNANASEENNYYDRIMVMTEANTVSTGKDFSLNNDDDDSEVPPPPGAEENPTTTEERSSKKKSFMSFLPFGGKQNESADHDDDMTLDSFGLKLKSFNNVSYNDDDSMMGYSLTSLSRIRQEAQQDESLLQDESTLHDESTFVDHETLSAASSVSDSAYNDQVFAGVQREKNYDNSTLGGESLSRVDTFETEDGEDASADKDDESDNGDAQSVVSAVLSVASGIAAAASKYFGEDELMKNEKIRSSAAPSEEFRSPSPILRVDSVDSEVDIPIIPNTASDPDMPMLPSDTEIPIIPNTSSDPDTPMLPSEADIPIAQDTSSDPDLDMPMLPSDADIPIVPNTPIIPDPRSDTETPVFKNTRSDADIPILPNAPIEPDSPILSNPRNDTETPVFQNTTSDADIPSAPTEPDIPIISNTRSDTETPVFQNTYVMDDAASDVPSDERMGPSSPIMRVEPSSHPDAVANSKLIDNDPAVLNYLVQGAGNESTDEL